MRIPHLINKSTFEAYKPSKVCLELESEQNRTIHAEDFEWDSQSVLPLVTLSLQVLCKNYEKWPMYYDELLQKDAAHFIEILSTDIPLELAIASIETDFYWERRFKATFGEISTCRFRLGLRWKEKFLERHVRKIIEEAQPQCSDEELILDILRLAAPYVKHLHIEELQPWSPPLHYLPEEIPDVFPIKHINFDGIFTCLYDLDEIELSYSLKKLSKEAKFSLKYFKISVEDFTLLGKAILRLSRLTILRIQNSLVEDDHTQALMQGLVENETLIELDLSHCKIGDTGAKCIAKLIMVHPKLTVLHLADNRIGAVGAQALAFALFQDVCCPLIHLNMRLNPLGHEGINVLFAYLVRAGKLLEINLAGCGFDDPTAMRFGDLISMGSMLKKVDISNNYIQVPGAEYISECLEKNSDIIELDVRETDIPPHIDAIIRNTLKRNVKIEKGEDPSSHESSSNSSSSSSSNDFHTTIVRERSEEMSAEDLDPDGELNKVRAESAEILYSREASSDEEGDSSGKKEESAS